MKTVLGSAKNRKKFKNKTEMRIIKCLNDDDRREITGQELQYSYSHHLWMILMELIETNRINIEN